MPGTILGIGNKAVNKTNKSSCPYEAYVLMGSIHCTLTHASLPQVSEC